MSRPGISHQITLSQLRHFVCLADEMHFGRAAAKSGIAQPPFSQSIKRLEVMLGLTLVSRTRHSVALTPAGEAFAREARSVLQKVELSQIAAHRAATGEVDEIRIGFLEPSLFKILPNILHGFRDLHPDAALSLVEHKSTKEVVSSLQNNTIDLGIFRRREIPMDGLETRVIENERLVVCVSAQSPLAGRKELRLVDLSAEPFIMYPPHVQPEIDEATISACRRAGFIPRIERQPLSALTMLKLVAVGLGIAFVPECSKYSGFQGLAYIPVADLPQVDWELLVGWRPENMSAPLKSLIDLAQTAEATAERSA